MANGVQTQIKPEVLAIAGLLAVGGIALVLIGMGQGAGPGPVPEKFGSLTFARIATPSNPGSNVGPGSGTLNVTAGETITVVNPTYVYQGGGKDIFAFARIVQNNAYGNNITVQGSGLSVSRAMQSATPTAQKMVPIANAQPGGCLNAGTNTFDLCMVPWPGAAQISICGAPAQLGPATLLLEIWAFDGVYQNSSCRAVTLLGSAPFSGKINFV